MIKAVFKKEFTRDVKKHIDDISRKYILPGRRNYGFLPDVCPFRIGLL
jgi:hypothetical protein